MEETMDAFIDIEVEMLSLSRCKKLREPSILEATQVLFWAISAGYGGDISKSQLKMKPDLSEFSMKTECLDLETDKLYCSFIAYLFCVAEIIVKRAKFLEDYDEVIWKTESSITFSIQRG